MKQRDGISLITLNGVHQILLQLRMTAIFQKNIMILNKIKLKHNIILHYLGQFTSKIRNLKSKITCVIMHVVKMIGHRNIPFNF